MKSPFLLHCCPFVDNVIILLLSTIVKRPSIIYNNIGVKILISYEPLYKTMKEKGITTYKLINEFGVSRSLLDRLKHNKPISTVTLNDLCSFLDCRVEDILVYTKDE